MQTHSEKNPEHQNKNHQNDPHSQQDTDHQNPQPMPDTPQARLTAQLQSMPMPDTPQARLTAQLQSMPMPDTPQARLIAQLQGKPHPTSPQTKTPNSTGLPDQLKAEIENLSGHSMDDVKVHYNSDKPAQLQAHAYAQGADIHLGPGQEKHLPHEAWHVVQQKQGRVAPTVQGKGGVKINDDTSLEKEADAMGEKATKTSPLDKSPAQLKSISSSIVQRTVWEWAGEYWNPVRTEGMPTPQPGHSGNYYGERTSTGTESDLWGTGVTAAAPIVAAPAGYTLVSDQTGTQQAYLADPKGYGPTEVPLDHIVAVAHNETARIHRSANMEGHSQDTYVHPNDHELYTFSTQGNHTDGIPMITIHEKGKVRGGWHKFS